MSNVKSPVVSEPQERLLAPPQRTGPSGWDATGHREAQRNHFRASPFPPFLPLIPVPAIQTLTHQKRSSISNSSPRCANTVPAPPRIIFESGIEIRLPRMVSKKNPPKSTITRTWPLPKTHNANFQNAGIFRIALPILFFSLQYVYH